MFELWSLGVSKGVVQKGSCGNGVAPFMTSHFIAQPGMSFPKYKTKSSVKVNDTVQSLRCVVLITQYSRDVGAKQRVISAFIMEIGQHDSILRFTAKHGTHY